MYFRRDRGIMSLDEFPQFEGSDVAMSPLARAEAVEMSEWVRSCMADLGEWLKQWSARAARATTMPGRLMPMFRRLTRQLVTSDGTETSNSLPFRRMRSGPKSALQRVCSRPRFHHEREGMPRAQFRSHYASAL